LQVLQSVVFLLSQQAEAPDLQHSFLGASGQVPQLVRPMTRARVASTFMMVVVLLDEMKRPVITGISFTYEHARHALFLVSTKSQLGAWFIFSVAMWRARFATSMRWAISQMAQVAT